MNRKGIMIGVLLLGGLLLLLRPQFADRRAMAEPMRTTQASERVGVVDLVLGAETGPEEFLFDGIRGIAVDSAGRIFVVDRSRYVRVYSPSGSYLYRFGGAGEGPGELNSPCCINFDGYGRLWVQDRLYSLDVFDTGSTGARFVERINFLGDAQLMPRGQLDPLMPVVALEGGDVGASAIRSTGSGERERGLLLLDRDGRVQSTRWLPHNDSFPTLHVSAGGTRTVPVPPPYAHVRFVAVSPLGRIATAVNYEYAIEVTDLEGAESGVMRQDVVGPAITEHERDSVVVAYEFDGLTLVGDLVIPARKPVLRALWYDSDGRLWVERSRAGGADQTQADVHDQDGSLLFKAFWPADVAFNRGGSSGSAVSGDTAYGIRTGPMGVQQVVRVVFRERPQ